MAAKKTESNISKRDNYSEIKNKKNIPSSVKGEKIEEFKKSKLRNKGKGSNQNLGGSLGDQTRKKKLL